MSSRCLYGQLLGRSSSLTTKLDIGDEAGEEALARRVAERIQEVTGKTVCLLFYVFLPTTNVRPEIVGNDRVHLVEACEKRQ